MKRFRSALALLPALVLCAAPLLRAQQPVPPPGPVPAPIQSAQKIFIANAGMDAFSLQAFRELGLNGTSAYDSLYTTIKSWPNYQLVSSPADADLVLEIRVTAPLTNVGEHATWDFQHILANTTWQFQTDLVIRDAKSHFLLWTVTEPVRPANLAGTWRKNIATANAAVAGDLKSLLTPSAPPTP
ncbi:MAG: hypothetical protein WCC27_02035 [Acidobacteriaceae bacterium]